ncbi:MAG TPA: hypothetical protein VM557_14790 [Thermoanaerobaculia bacterium]|nr:hypothetical protein [Thermoanaerobaculia bacterium]
MTKISDCPNCGSRDQYRSVKVSSGGGYAPNYLPGLARWLSLARFSIVLCRECGLARFFASDEARGKVADSKKWERLR